MALTPKERADFDEIVLRLRLEDAQLRVLEPSRRAFPLLVSVVGATLVLGLGVALVDQGAALGPVLIALVVTVCMVLTGYWWFRVRPGRPGY
jgi:hypothetical protein